MAYTSTTGDSILKGVNVPLFAVTGGFIAAFCGLALIDIDLLKELVNAGFGWSVQIFGAYWQVLLLLTFVIGLFMAFSGRGSVVLGKLDKPEFTVFQWGAMIMCTLLAGGGVFWAAGEPMAHFLSPPPLFGVEAKTPEAAYPALAQAFMHWGFLAWAILGALTTVVLMYYHYEKGLPLAPRTLLYPVFKERALKGPIGLIADASCIIAVVAGTVGPIGFLGLQVSYGLQDLFGLSDGFASQAVVIAVLVGIYTASAVTGVNKGIQILSRFNVVLACGLLIFMFLFGPTAFIVDSFVHSFGVYVDKFIPMAMFRAESGWLGWWTVFFWGWFLGYGPLMAMFIARVSRGRSIRQIVIMLSIIAPIVTCFWFTIVGGSGIAFELANPGSVSSAFEGFNLPAALLAITKQLPAGFLISVLFLILTTVFVATTGDSMTYCISVAMSDSDTPSTPVRVFWGIAMGVMAIILISLGSGGVSALQSFIVVTAVPVSLVLLPSLWAAPQIAGMLEKRDRESTTPIAAEA
ncbi:BCCT family transporter [Kiloniella majae]|uniref:BCCT family transporter n=1 Tax=Kiloniella majae TaxID=1938558 RepID=UPI000A278AA3|nr:BCCT family transporter [Kiloniella majae]